MSEELPYSQAVFFIDVDKVRPNPYQPRKEFDQQALASLADSIKQYGVLQPLVVTRVELEKEEGGIVMQYELIAGERRLRASKLAGIGQVPAVIREGHDTDKAKLELAIIENIQREELNPIDRAEAFSQLATEFGLTHVEIGKKIGKSREYVSNSIRLLLLPQEILNAVREGRISEGHTRPLLMLNDRKEAQDRLFEDIVTRKLTVRDAEQLSRRAAQDKMRRPQVIFDKNTFEIEDELSRTFGTRVKLEKKEKGGKISIEFFSPEDLDSILDKLSDEKKDETSLEKGASDAPLLSTEEEKKSNDEDLYSVSNFSV